MANAGRPFSAMPAWRRRVPCRESAPRRPRARGQRDTERERDDNSQSDPGQTDDPRRYPLWQRGEGENQRGETRPHDAQNEKRPRGRGTDERGEPRLLARAGLAEERHDGPAEQRRKNASERA